MLKKTEKQSLKNAGEDEDIEGKAQAHITNATTKSDQDTSHQSKQRGNDEKGRVSNKMADRCGKLRARIKTARTKQKRGKALHAFMMCKRGK